MNRPRLDKQLQGRGRLREFRARGLSSFRGLALRPTEPQHQRAESRSRNSSKTLAEVAYLVSRFERKCEQACACAEQMVAQNRALMRGTRRRSLFPKNENGLMTNRSIRLTDDREVIGNLGATLTRKLMATRATRCS